MYSYVVVSRYQAPNKRAITHVYSGQDWEKKDAVNMKSRILRDFMKENPDKYKYLTVSVCKIIDLELMNKQFFQVTSDTRPHYKKELQGPHQGPSGEVLI